MVKKDATKEKHDAITVVPNLHVMKLMISLKSRGYVKETFNWQYSYYTLTDEGIAYLRTYMSIPEETVPDTLKVKQVARARFDDAGRGRGGGRGGFGGRGRGFGGSRDGPREGGFGGGRGRGFGGRGRGAPVEA